ncbi:MAG: DEAD/DEAH box helicase [Rhodospirillales bacterium]|nr:DEAD/DEAH box helicase [Rhodospirillales bacterium]
MTFAERFYPGELVRARGREWVVMEAGATGAALALRPLTGSEADIETIIPDLEAEPVSHASFGSPDARRTGGRDAAQLLRDALRLSLRRGAGPFRSAGRINFEPRAYQLAPLMMALRLETIRLLIADDVGIGKTIEAGLILREMLDRGEIGGFTVLCPPHLVEQWTHELKSKFSIPATPVTASAAAGLERDLPASMSIFEAWKFTVVSLDFIKSERRKFDFLRACPEMVVVDEAHAAVSGGQGRQRRYELVRSLADDGDRHMVLLTATPHSGDETAFHNLLGLIDPEFSRLADPALAGEAAQPLRERLARHFIQRRRSDIDAWREPGLFPQHETSEIRYRLTGDYEAFYERILDYCAGVVRSQEGDLRQRLAFWGTLALMRCVGSSPAAAARALKTRAQYDEASGEPDGEASGGPDGEAGQFPEQQLAARTLDDGDMAPDDLEPGADIGGRGDPRLDALVRQAGDLSADMGADPKYQALLRALKELTAQGFSPVVFCRYIATAEQLSAALADAFRHHMVEVVTGALPSEEREERVAFLGEQEKRLLVATDCLSEGINLQDWFDAVIHYDLAWNPTRHQQREGRVDRFGQKSPVVRSLLVYGENNPVDGAVLNVILRKARAIEKRTGVRVPLPDDSGSLTKALMSAVLLRASGQKQLALDLQTSQEARRIDLAWENASGKEKRSRTIFAQRTLKPDDVIAEWNATRSTLGDYADTQRFVVQAMKRLDAALTPLDNGGYRAPVHLAPQGFRERFVAESLIGEATDTPVRVAFSARPPAGCVSVHRAHSLPAVLAETLLEQALDPLARQDDLAALPRTGAWECTAVEEVTWLAVLRIRHRLNSRGKFGPNFSMAEEAAALAISATDRTLLFKGEQAFRILEATGGDLPETIRREQIERGLGTLPALASMLDAHAEGRARHLAQDHTRVRQALGSRARIEVTPITPVDVIGFYVLLPGL